QDERREGNSAYVLYVLIEYYGGGARSRTIGDGRLLDPFTLLTDTCRSHCLFQRVTTRVRSTCARLALSQACKDVRHIAVGCDALGDRAVTSACPWQNTPMLLARNSPDRF